VIRPGYNLQGHRLTDILPHACLPTQESREIDDLPAFAIVPIRYWLQCDKRIIDSYCERFRWSTARVILHREGGYLRFSNRLKMFDPDVSFL
jgi:hypothetical protein